MVAMRSYRNEPERRLEELLETANLRDASEDDIKRRVANLIESLVDDQQARLEVGTESGSIDILFGNVIIEAKTRRDRLFVAPSWARSDQHRRRDWAASQLQDYVNDRYGGVKSASSIFVGYTTNGTSWIRWDVTVGGEVPTEVWSKHLDQGTLDNLAKVGRTRSEVMNDLLDDLVQHLETRPGPPDDLGELLADLPDSAYQLAVDLSGQPDFEIKRSVWSDLMRGAFVLAPGTADQDLRLFATHSVLVDMARKVANNVTGNEDASTQIDDSAFYSWVYAGDAETPVAQRISREVNRYNWRLANSDVLKGVYHGFIPRSVRHDFGEYYTPDWLAEAVCEHVLDDEWCNTAVKRAADHDDDLRGIGVLEPSCGSGSFLRAAVLRLLPYAQRETEDAVEQANIVCRLVHGLDIHPVAVELAKATILAALPATPTQGHDAVNVHISDSLRWMQDTDMRLLGDGILINVPQIGELQQVDVLVPNSVVLHDQFGEVIDDMLTHGGNEVLIPNSVVLHDQFGEVIDDMLTHGGNEVLIRSRLAHYGIMGEDADSAVTAATTLHRLRAEDRNHVWGWYIKNVAEAHRLHERRFDRIVGNPPWITRKDITKGDKARAERYRSEAIRLGIWAGGAIFATQNNLAALFAAAVTRDYANPDQHWKVGYVLPWSALRTQTWSNFRSGGWSEVNVGTKAGEAVDLSESPWDLRCVAERPFPQSDSCVIFGQSSASNSPVALSDVHLLWESENARPDAAWTDFKSGVAQRPISAQQGAESEYLDRLENGATLFPIALIRIDPGSLRSGGTGFRRFKLQKSRHGVWSNVDLGELTIEEECVREVAYAEDLAPFRRLSKSWVVLPPDRAILADEPMAEIGAYGRFANYWTEADRLWRQHHGTTPPATLLDRVDHQSKLTLQLDSKMGYRVAYPGSGRWLSGTKMSSDVIVNHGCLYISVESEREADFLCAVLSSDALQDAFRESQVTDRHYDKHPLRSVPIPAYDGGNAVHAELVSVADRASLVAAEVTKSSGTSKMRSDIRDALREDGVMSEIDRCVTELLPDYVNLAA